MGQKKPISGFSVPGTWDKPKSGKIGKEGKGTGIFEERSERKRKERRERNKRRKRRERNKRRERMERNKRERN